MASIDWINSKESTPLKIPSLSPGFGRDIAGLLEGISKHIAGLPVDGEQLSLPDSQRISHLKRHLNDVRDVQRALTSLSNTVASSISSLENQFSALFIRDRYSQFPDDIFTIIFKSAAFNDFRSAISISHVCQRFRSIALSIPQLWTSILPKKGRGMSVENASEVAGRSQHSALGLTVEMQSFDPYANGHVDYLESMMSFISVHFSRISTLTLDLGTAHAVASKNKSWSTKMSLPVLESLKINAPPSTRLEHFYRDWSVPSLHILRGRNCMPRLPSDVLSKITYFSFEVEEYDSWDDNRVRWLLIELASYLNKLTSVEEVSMDFDCDQVHYRMMEDALPKLQTSQAQLSRISRLSFTAPSGRVDVVASRTWISGFGPHIAFLPVTTANAQGTRSCRRSSERTLYWRTSISNARGMIVRSSASQTVSPLSG
ncbi:hypothetical protein SCHPADRAFT_384038 [Schizopora paradoxa]|uniref:F-box domain-containing protein n=1 Tax=Schizopora paradoxa TaxID=27342 RepID=A0A0H2RNE3_9AGAM|nr:hypothetical protein SCHPADRAFT_384038 [Schizopora paradoxa]